MSVYQELLKIAKRRHIRVIEESLPEELVFFNGIFAHCLDMDMIVINKDKPWKEKEFTLAHELGHYQLHRLTVDLAYYEADNDYHNFIEDEANRFANRLLAFLAWRLERGL